MTDVSIIIASFNTKELTLQCIKSIVDSAKQIKYEIIVVDNGSTDGSVGELTKLTKLTKLIKLVKNSENLGFAKANNQGIKIAKGRYILLLNTDTKVKNGAIEKLINFAEETPDAGAVGPRLLNPDGSTQPSVFRLPTISRVITQYWLGKNGLLDKYSPQGPKPDKVESLVMAAFLITPEALKEVGFLDERYFMFYEDLDYCRRVWKSGLKVYYLPRSEVVHYHGASGKKIAEEVNQWRRLIPSSKIYHGLMKHYVINFIIWSGQKWKRLVNTQS